MPPLIDPLESPRYALEGRIVTMNDAFDVIPDGRVYVDAGRIAAVLPADAPVPAGLEDAPVVATGATVYPGLIELHNHLSYNALPAWPITERFANRDQWARRATYRQLVSGPAGVLGRTDGLVQAVVRYVEAKCLVAGVTTTQGLALASNSGIRRFYRGIVRNVEQTNDSELPHSSTRIADVEATDATRFLERLERESTLLLHLSEGVDDRARSHFQALQIDGNRWAITRALGGIHCCGLRDDDYGTLAVNHGSMVWSPFSNLLLYGRTADIARARREGVIVALGSDWSPSGSRNLLGELKVARLVSDEAGGVLTARDIAAMATINAARILKWERSVGSLQPGKRADLLVVHGSRDDPYDQLVEARETSVTLVVINGVPRCGSPRLMEALGVTGESCRVGSSTRVLNLIQPTADPLVGALTLAEATDRLRDALGRLPELERSPRSTEGAREAGPRADPGQRWFLELDQAPMDGSSIRLKPPLGMDMSAELEAVRAPSDLPLVPLRLDPLTVMDDAGFDEQVEGQPNLSDHIKRELPRFYGA